VKSRQVDTFVEPVTPPRYLPVAPWVDEGESAEQDDPGAGAPARPRPVPVHKSVVERDTSLVKHELERDPSGTASAADGGRGEWYVAGPEFIAVAAHVLLREHRELVQVIRSLDVPWLESLLVEDSAVVRHVLVGVMDQTL